MFWVEPAPENRYTCSVFVNRGGYVMKFVGRDHPMSNRKGYCLEHRAIMAELIGRPLTRTEVVHHIDGNRANNASENLELCADRVSHARKHRPDGVLAREKVLAAIVALTDEHGYAPTVRELQAHFGFASPSPIQASLAGLARDGRITWHPKIARTIKVVA